ncbi:UNVERIFIED_CONTAM: hypothetical protein Slati_2490700 [Sesamum latifolium]|uniref:Reverse transcriptase zinc-binding domain-containing protein n=1 Tax=Sesamum latifolium TaxID=2727402 RepID=A0AAW2WEL1_9LAMI
MLDKPWVSHLDGACIRCINGQLEMHSHLFFSCRFSRQCLDYIQHHIRFPWPHRDWEDNVMWAATKWRGKHVINAAYRALLASLVYHIRKEHNRRRFQQEEQSYTIVGRTTIEEIRQRILSVELPFSISTIALVELLE